MQASAALKARFTPTGDGNGRLTVAELTGVPAATWETAILVIPLALVEDPRGSASRPPTAELYIRAGEKYTPEGQPEYKELPNVIDLSSLGKATGTQLRQGGISVTAPLETRARTASF